MGARPATLTLPYGKARDGSSRGMIVSPDGTPDGTQPWSPRVLISYSHDSPAHEARVLALADRLRDDGVDAILDQYEPFPPQGWIQWMNQQVWTRSSSWWSAPKPTAGVPGRRARCWPGATYESQIVQQLLYNDSGLNEQFIPVVLTEEDRAAYPDRVAALSPLPGRAPATRSSTVSSPTSPKPRSPYWAVCVRSQPTGETRLPQSSMERARGTTASPDARPTSIRSTGR